MSIFVIRYSYMRSIFILPFICLCLASCKKTDSPDYVPCYPLTPSPERIAEESYFDGPDTTFSQKLIFIYDTAGRLKYKLSSTGSIPDTVETYRYFNDKVTVNLIEYQLNEQGLALTGSFPSYSPYFTWEYDAQGYKTRETIVYAGGSNSSAFFHVCYNTDRVIIRHQVHSSAYTDTTYYSYYSGKLNTTGNENHGIYFFGRQDNLLVRSVVTGGRTVYTNDYVFDSLGRVQWTITTYSPESVFYRKFTYL